MPTLRTGALALAAVAQLLSCGPPTRPPPAPPVAVAPAWPVSAPLAAAEPTEVPRSPPAGEIARHVVLVSIDGMRPDAYTQADPGLAIPNLRRLMARGRFAKAVVGTWPTVTYPAHTTLVTGARPNTHGILANGPFDPTYRNQGGWNWYAESIKADTLWAALRRAGKTTGAVYWPVTVGAPINDNFPQVWRAKVDEDDHLLRALTTPGLVDAYAKEYGALPAEHRTDHERANAAEMLVREKRHDLTLVYFTDLDEAQHAYGPGSKQARATLARIDTELGRILRGIEEAGDAARTAVLVVSDHGFSPVKSVVRPAVLLREAGLIDVGPGGGVRNWKAGVLAAGGLAAIYVRDPQDAATLERVREVLEKAAADPRMGIRAVLPKAVSEKAGGFAGASFALEAAPGFEFDRGLNGAPVGLSSDKGAHGYPPETPDMMASLIAAGDGIKAGAPLERVSMLSIAPTVAALLGVSLRDAELPPLAELLADAPSTGAGRAAR